MGCSFNCVVVPESVKTQKQLKEFYKKTKEDLILEYGGEDFEGYSGDLAVDSGLSIRKDLVLRTSEERELTQEDFANNFDELLKLCEGNCEKWGPSIAIRWNNQWAICGAYSD
jgi:hypothetical protein